MTDLATLEAVKAKLGIDPADTSRDADLTGIVNGVNTYIRRRTRFALEDGDVTGEIHEHVREGDAVYVRQRPIDPAGTIVVEGREFGSDAWITLLGDLVDPVLGKVRIMGASNTVRPWPLRQFPGTLQGRWRRFRWPVLRMSYAVLAATDIDDLTNAANALAAYSDISGAGTGAEVAETVGQVVVQWSDTSARESGALPPSIDAIVEGYVYPKGRLAG